MNTPLTLDLMYTRSFQPYEFEYHGLAPTMVDPKTIPRIISDNKYVMAVTDGKKTFYVTSDHQEAIYVDQDKKNIPYCTDICPDWIRTTPWEHLSHMKVLQSGNFIVFVPQDFNEMHITIHRYRFIPELQAIMVYGSSCL